MTTLNIYPSLGRTVADENGITIAPTGLSVTLATTTAGSATAVILTGSADFAIGSGAGKMNILANSQTQLYNKLGETVTYVVKVVCI